MYIYIYIYTYTYTYTYFIHPQWGLIIGLAGKAHSEWDDVFPVTPVMVTGRLVIYSNRLLALLLDNHAEKKGESSRNQWKSWCCLLKNLVCYWKSPMFTGKSMKIIIFYRWIMLNHLEMGPRNQRKPSRQEEYERVHGEKPGAKSTAEGSMGGKSCTSVGGKHSIYPLVMTFTVCHGKSPCY